MRITVILLLLFGFWTSGNAAAQSNACKECRDQQRACQRNHSEGACKTEYEICLKHCEKRR